MALFSHRFVRIRDRKSAPTPSRNGFDRAVGGNLGTVRGVGAGVSEMKIDYGPGTRIYVHQRGNVLVIFRCENASLLFFEKRKNTVNAFAQC
jgi:putative addiction module killer protein